MKTEFLLFHFFLVKIDEDFFFFKLTWNAYDFELSQLFVCRTQNLFLQIFIEMIPSVIVISCIVGKLVLNNACCMAVIYGDCYNSWLDTGWGYQ